jgi:DNA polymerase-1
MWFPKDWSCFSSIWSVDFEYASNRGTTAVPTPHTFCAMNVGDRSVIRLDGDRLRARKRAPFDLRRSLVLAYAFTAESECFEVLGWPQPQWAVDLYAEHLIMRNGHLPADDKPLRFGLTDFAKYLEVEVSIEHASHKHAMQERSDQGEPFSEAERLAITDYCVEDVELLVRIFLTAAPRIDLAPALVRGLSMVSLGQQHFRGIPVNRPAIEKLQTDRLVIRESLIKQAADAQEFFPNGKFKGSAFVSHLTERGIGWPLDFQTGRPNVDKSIWAKMAKLEPRVAPYAQLRANLAKLDNFTADIKSDDRIRPNFWPFRTVTTRNRPTASDNLLVLPKFFRGFLQAPVGGALGQADFSTEEVFIAAALSGDKNLLRDLETDVYIRLATRSGLVPAGATPETHPEERAKCKIALLAMIYGIGDWSLAKTLETDLGVARSILRAFSRDYATLVSWLETVVYYGYRDLQLTSILGTPWSIGPNPKIQSQELRNHLIQTTGADILRAACLHAMKAGIRVIATLHDSILIEERAESIDAQVALLQECMEQAAYDVLGVRIPAKKEFAAREYQLKDKDRAMFELVTSWPG